MVKINSKKYLIKKKYKLIEYYGLDLSNKNLKHIPHFKIDCEKINFINLNNNQLKEINKNIYQLNNVIEIDLGNNFDELKLIKFISS